MPEVRPEHTVEMGMLVRTYRGAATVPTVLYLHGLGESGLCFEAVVAEPPLAGLRQLVPDLPGYGRSAWPGRPLGLEEVADHLAAWLRWRGEHRVVVVGHSLGGVLGQLLSERHGELVHALVDVDGNICDDDCTFSGQAAAIPEEEFVTSGFDGLREVILARAVETGDRAQLGYYVSLRLADPSSYHRHSEELVALSSSNELARRLAGLPMPVLYVAGCPNGASSESLRQLSDARVELERIEEAGHWPFIDRPRDFATIVATWVGALSRTATTPE